MPRPRVPDGRPVSDRPAPPNAYRSGCAQEPAVAACRGLLAAVSSAQVIPRINLRPPSSSHRCSYHIDGITPRQPLQTFRTKTFTRSEVRAQGRWRDPEAALKNGNGKVTRGLSGVKMKRGAIAAFPRPPIPQIPRKRTLAGAQKSTRMTPSGQTTAKLSMSRLFKNFARTDKERLNLLSSSVDAGPSRCRLGPSVHEYCAILESPS